MKRLASRHAALLAVLGGHALLLALLSLALQPPPRGRGAPLSRPPALWLRLPPLLATPPTPTTAGPPTARPRTDRPPPARATPRPAPGPAAPAPARPADEPLSAAITLPRAPLAPAAPASAASAPPPLDLRLRPGSAGAAPAAALAREDPRLPAPRSREQRLADALGTDTRLREEALGDGSHRLRRGSACARVHTARDAQLDPFNQSTRPTPRLVGEC